MSLRKYKYVKQHRLLGRLSVGNWVVTGTPFTGQIITATVIAAETAASTSGSKDEGEHKSEDWRRVALALAIILSIGGEAVLANTETTRYDGEAQRQYRCQFK